MQKDTYKKFYGLIRNRIQMLAGFINFRFQMPAWYPGLFDHVINKNRTTRSFELAYKENLIKLAEFVKVRRWLWGKSNIYFLDIF